MPNIGPVEIAIVVIIALVVFGPKKLPSLGRSVGESLREFKSSVSGEDKKDKPAVTQAESPVSAATEAPKTPAAAPAPALQDDV